MPTENGGGNSSTQGIAPLRPLVRAAGLDNRAAVTAGVPLRTIHLTDRIATEVYDAALVLIRPDMMIAWRSDEPPTDPTALLDTIRGA